MIKVEFEDKLKIEYENGGLSLSYESDKQKAEITIKTYGWISFDLKPLFRAFNCIETNWPKSNEALALRSLLFLSRGDMFKIYNPIKIVIDLVNRRMYSPSRNGGDRVLLSPNLSGLYVNGNNNRVQFEISSPTYPDYISNGLYYILSRSVSEVLFVGENFKDEHVIGTKNAMFYNSHGWKDGDVEIVKKISSMLEGWYYVFYDANKKRKTVRYFVSDFIRRGGGELPFLSDKPLLNREIVPAVLKLYGITRDEVIKVIEDGLFTFSGIKVFPKTRHKR